MRQAVLTIAGTDPTGGAGIQADLQVLSHCGVHGMAVPTALIEQDSRGVRSVHAVFPSIVEAQLLDCLRDAPPAVVKIGALATEEITRIVARLLQRFGPLPTVLDPVLEPSTGPPLLERRAWNTLREDLIPLATIITPNLSEAGTLADIETPTTLDAMAPVAREISKLGPPWVLIKGGHLEGGDPTDLLVHGGEVLSFSGKRFAADVHGTGCALSSAVAAGLALGLAVPEAVARAHAYVQSAIARSEQRGRGKRTLNYAVPF